MTNLDQDIGGFHVTLYQANFARHTCVCHIGFLSPRRSRYWGNNKLFHYFLFSLSTIPNYNWVIIISAHTLGWNFKSFHEVNRKFKQFLLFFLHTTLYKRKPRAATISWVRTGVPPSANPLLVTTDNWKKQINQYKKSWSNCSEAAIAATKELQSTVMSQCILIHTICLSVTDNYENIIIDGKYLWIRK